MKPAPCTRRTRSAFLACVLGVFSMPMVAVAAADHWEGVVTSNAMSSTRVEARFTDREVSLHFGEPANCRLVGALLHRDDGVTYYRFHPAQNGGAFCTRLYPGEVTVAWPSADVATLTFHRGDTLWKGMLTPVSTP